MATATFREIGHIYEQDGVAIPSVTQVLTLAGIDDVSHIPLYYLERAAALGPAVHEACEFLDQDDLDLDSLDSTIVGYVLGYQKFKEETGFAPNVIEKRGVSASSGLAYGYCVDRLGVLDGQPVLLDIKTSSKVSHAWPIQTAAYAEATNFGNDNGEGLRLIVHVAKDGSYKLIRQEDVYDFHVWGAALKVAHWKLNHGGKLPR